MNNPAGLHLRNANECPARGVHYNTYAILFLKDEFTVENLIVREIDNWLKNMVKLPENGEMIKYIKRSTDLEKVNKILNLDSHYKKIRDTCNDHVHYNLFHYLMLNDNRVYMESKLTALGELSGFIRDIFIKHFIWLFTLNDHYMTSSDYIDNLELGFAPETGSQYFVAPFIQEVFDGIIKKHRMDLASELKNASCMKLA